MCVFRNVGEYEVGCVLDFVVEGVVVGYVFEIEWNVVFGVVESG